jgi:hypothetical protein
MHGVLCDGPGNKIESINMRPGWWRSGPESKDVRSCPLAEACIGGNRSFESVCATGYNGPLCSQCAHDFFRGWASQACERCAGKEKQKLMKLVGIGVVVTVVIGLWGYLIIKRCCRRTGKEEVKNGPGLLLILFRVLRVKGFLLFITAQVLYNFSNVSSTTTRGSTRFPEPAWSFIRGLSFVQCDIVALVPLACVFKSSSFYHELVLQTVAPVSVVLLMWSIAVLRVIAGAQRDFATALGLSMLFLELCLPSVSTTIFETFVCVVSLSWFSACL